MKRIAPLALLTIILSAALPTAASGGIQRGHRLPEGRERAVRERQVDVQRGPLAPTGAEDHAPKEGIGERHR